jgi:GTP-binding protein
MITRKNNDIQIREAEFLTSSTDFTKCPAPDKPEYAFIGRSNVGKSSLINMLTQRQKLAKVSGRPGKTQTIIHFLINKSWYLVDLPGYGYARTSISNRQEWQKFIADYIVHRENLYCLFILVDARHEPLNIDLNFIHWAGNNQIPLALVFTKTDKLSPNELNHNISVYKKQLKQYWEELPTMFYTSSEKNIGRDEILRYIHDINFNTK